MSERKAKFGTQAALTITLTSLGNGAGRISNQVDLTDAGGLASDKLLINFKFKTATAPTAGTLISFYLVRGDEDGTTPFVDGGLGTSDAAMSTIATLDQLQLVFNQVVNATANNVYTGSFVLFDPGPRFSLLVWNGIGQSLSSTSTDHVIRWTPLTDSIA